MPTPGLKPAAHTCVAMRYSLLAKEKIGRSLASDARECDVLISIIDELSINNLIDQIEFVTIN